VNWDGKQLSIKAENSTLADILRAVRASTNAVIEIPSGVGAERVVTDLGPGSPREVLTLLLNGSNFDYVIVASPDDKDVLQSVLLTPRGKGETATGDIVAASDPGMRRPRGYTQADRQALDAAVEAVNGANAPESVASATTSVVSQNAGSESTQTASATGQEPSSADATVASPDSAIAVAGTGERLSILNPGAPVEIPAGATAGAAMPQMMQDLQQMYQKRRQIQTQVNQVAVSPTN
jgi:hypothetical protein